MMPTSKHRTKKNKLPFFKGWVGLLLISSLSGTVARAESLPLNSTASPDIIFEQWAVTLLQGKQCGFTSTTTTKSQVDGKAQFTTTTHEEFAVKRMGNTLKIVTTSRVTENEAGVVLSFSQNTSGAGTNQNVEGTRDGDILVVRSRGTEQHYQVPATSALGPEKIRQLLLKVPLKAGETFSFATFTCDYPRGAVVQGGKVVDSETRYVRGVPKRLWRIVSGISITPGLLSTIWVDDQGQDVEDSFVLPGIGDLQEYVTDRSECTKELVGVELFQPTLIRPSRLIAHPHQETSAAYRITSQEKNRPLILWNQEGQKSTNPSPGICEVEVKKTVVDPTEVKWTLPNPPANEMSSLEPYLHATAYLESSAPEIKTLAQQAVGDEKNPVIASQKIEEFVRRYINKKDLDIGFASALETAKSREGDCTEHAVLCAAIGRAAGIPTRCVLGLAYIPPGSGLVQSGKDTGVFGFHMWAESWVGTDQWVPMDAALNGFDVGHITLLKTALGEANPMVELNLPIFQMMQKLKIDVIALGSEAPAPDLKPQVASANSMTTVSNSVPTTTLLSPTLVPRDEVLKIPVPKPVKQAPQKKSVVVSPDYKGPAGID